MRARGSVTRRKTYHGVRPSVAAAVSRRGSTARKAVSALITTNGAATNSCASTTAGHVLMMLMPACSKKRPRYPFGPTTSVSSRPPTMGGSTNGSTTAARTSAFPRNVFLTSRYASGTPSQDRQSDRQGGRAHRQSKGLPRSRVPQRLREPGPGKTAEDRQQRDHEICHQQCRKPGQDPGEARALSSI